MDPSLLLSDLGAERGMLVIAQVRVEERVVADFLALPDEVLQLAPLVLRLIEQPVRAAGPGQDEERGRAPEVRALPEERFQNADPRLRVDLEGAVALEVAELAWRGVVEGQHHRRHAGGGADWAGRPVR